MSLDITAATAPESDRLNTDDFTLGPRTVKVEKVTEARTDKGTPTVHVHFREYPGRPLKPRKNVLRLLGKGLTAMDISVALGISRNTCTTHIKAIYRKLGISTRAEAALEANRRGLV